MKKLKACICIDDWKLPIFKRHLEQGGYEYTTSRGPTKDTFLMTVHTGDLNTLAIVVRAANSEASGEGTRQ